MTIGHSSRLGEARKFPSRTPTCTFPLVAEGLTYPGKERGRGDADGLDYSRGSCLPLYDRPGPGDTERAWQALRAGGHLALLRHAEAPGVGDPPGFRLDDCATQRTLSAEGKAQARRIGEAFRSMGASIEAVYSSQWCRCVETGELLGLGPVTPLPVLNSFFTQDPARRERQTAELRAWLDDRRPRGSLVLVTHQVNITALTGVFPASGEAVVVKPLTGGEIEVIGHIPPP